MSLDPHALKIYIDGSSLRNPGGASGLAGRAEYPEHWDRNDETLFTVGFESSTNNRMELLACIRAMEHVRENVVGVQRVQIVTDSRYVHDNIPRVDGWRRNKWNNRYGRPIENADLWRSFQAARRKLNVRTDFVWLKGKKSRILKAIDSDAKAAARQQSERDYGFRDGKVGKSKVTSARTSATLFPADNQENVIHIYRKCLVNHMDRIDFDLYAEDQHRFTGKFRAYATPTLGIDLHRGHAYRVLFNNDPHYPKIRSIIAEIPKSNL